MPLDTAHPVPARDDDTTAVPRETGQQAPAPAPKQITDWASI